MRRSQHRLLPFLVSAIAVGASIVPAAAQVAVRREFHVPAQSLDVTLRAIALAAHQNVVAPSNLLIGRAAPALQGRYTPAEAVRLVLVGSGLHAERVGDSLIIRAGEAGPAIPVTSEAEIVVTGTRIRGAGPVGASVITIDRKAIESSGYATTQQIVQSLPQNFGGGPNEGTTGVAGGSNAGLNVAFGSSVNLRGLGPSSTLVLLNGNRPPLGGFSGLFADLSLIPVSAIERIEVLSDGASAIYGSDAVAGVVNVIPRDKFQGFETSFRYGSADGDESEVQASAILGKSWSSGHVVLAYEYNRHSNLSADDRAYATEDLRTFGGADHRSLYAAPGTIVAGSSTYAIPAGQNRSQLTPGQLVAGTANRGDQWRGADLIPSQNRHSLYATGSQELASHLSVYGELLFSDRRAFDHDRATDQTSVSVSSTNPFYIDPVGTGRPVQVRYDFNADLGHETTASHVRALGTLAGLKSDLGRWEVDLHGTYGVQTEYVFYGNLVNSARLGLALADTDPATAYNVFGDPHSTSQGTIDAVRGSTTGASRYRLWSTIARVDGPLFHLPAGDVKLAFGGEYRSELFTTPLSPSDTSTLTPTQTSTDGLPGERHIKALYGELLVPLFGPDQHVPLLQRLDFSAALRTEHYSDFGATTNPKLGLSWMPARDLTLRGTYGTSFRAPSFNDLRQGKSYTLYFAYPLDDPASPTGTTNALILRGNNPNVGPETARTFTAGFDYRPAFLPGVHLTTTYFDIRYRNRISDPSSQLLTVLVRRAQFAPIINTSPTAAQIASYYASPFFDDFVGVPASAVTTIVDGRTQNLSVQHERGVDFDIGWNGAALGGHAEIGLEGTRLIKLDQSLTATTPATSILDTIGNPVDLRLRGHVGWTGRRIASSLAVNYVGSYTNNGLTIPVPVSSWTTVDLSLRYTIPKGGSLGGLTLGLSATNVFDRDPPYAESVTGPTAVGFDPENANALGRVVALTLTKAW
jgi:iron complex outermembrane receptor protein